MTLSVVCTCLESELCLAQVFIGLTQVGACHVVGLHGFASLVGRLAYLEVDHLFGVFESQAHDVGLSARGAVFVVVPAPVPQRYAYHASDVP